MRIVDVHFQAFISINSVIFVVKVCILYGALPRSCQSIGAVAPVLPLPMMLLNLQTSLLKTVAPTWNSIPLSILYQKLELTRQDKQ